jgi:hypothetical protein
MTGASSSSIALAIVIALQLDIQKKLAWTVAAAIRAGAQFTRQP